MNFKPLQRFNFFVGIYITSLLVMSFGAAYANDWVSLQSDENCLMFTTEKKIGNLEYPSTFFFIYDKNQHAVGTAVQNFEWLLAERKSRIAFAVDNYDPKSLAAELQNNLMTVKASEIKNLLVPDFKMGNYARLLNAKGKQVAEFSLTGFTKAYDNFEYCIEAFKSKYAVKVANKNTGGTRSHSGLDKGSKDVLKFFLATAALFALANSDIPLGAYADNDYDPLMHGLSLKSRRSEAIDDFGRRSTFNSMPSRLDIESNSSSASIFDLNANEPTTYRQIGDTVRSSNGTTFRQIGNTIRSSDGVNYRQIGDTIRSSEGESWRRIGNTIRSSSGTSWRMIGDTSRSSDGRTCRSIGNIVRCY